MTLERAVFASVAGVGAALSLGAAFFAPHGAFSVTMGAAIAVLNLYAMREVVRVLTTAAAGGKAPPGTAFFLVLKQLGLFGLVLLLLSAHVISAGPFAIGYSALPIGVAIGALLCDKARS